MWRIVIEIGLGRANGVELNWRISKKKKIERELNINIEAMSAYGLCRSIIAILLTVRLDVFSVFFALSIWKSTNHRLDAAFCSSLCFFSGNQRFRLIIYSVSVWMIMMACILFVGGAIFSALFSCEWVLRHYTLDFTSKKNIEKLFETTTKYYRKTRWIEECSCRCRFVSQCQRMLYLFHSAIMHSLLFSCYSFDPILFMSRTLEYDDGHTHRMNNTLFCRCNIHEKKVKREKKNLIDKYVHMWIETMCRPCMGEPAAHRIYRIVLDFFLCFSLLSTFKNHIIFKLVYKTPIYTNVSKYFWVKKKEKRINSTCFIGCVQCSYEIHSFTNTNNSKRINTFKTAFNITKCTGSKNIINEIIIHATHFIAYGNLNMCVCECRSCLLNSRKGTHFFILRVHSVFKCTKRIKTLQQGNETQTHKMNERNKKWRV